MAAERLPMRKLREIIRLKLQAGQSGRAIARSCGLSPSTVGEYLGRIALAGLGWPLPAELDDDDALERLLFPDEHHPVSNRPEPDWIYVHRELQRRHVTKQLLWQEYKEATPNGLQYSQFCDRYLLWARPLSATMRQAHHAGEKTFVDFSGSGLDIVHPLTGDRRKAVLFVAVLGASNLTYAEPVLHQDLPTWVGCHVRAFEYFGGTTEIWVPDNPRVGVTKASKYEPLLNRTYEDLSAHFGAAVIPARPYKPRDKAKVEVAVLIASRWILAVLRNRTFYSLEEMRAAVAELLEKLNHRQMRRLKKSRRELFEEIERGALKPLPVRPFEYAEWAQPKVDLSYHVGHDGHFYSVHFSLIGEQLDLRATETTVEIFRRGARIESYPRSYERGKYTTRKHHMPRAHLDQVDWTPERLTSWAMKTGPKTAALLECQRRMEGTAVDPVVQAAVAAFGFVFVHPFEDGNGRIHRLLIHYILSRSGFAPKGIIFPVSAVMLQRRHEYDEALEKFSVPVMRLIDYEERGDGVVTVKNETAHLYRYFDATPMAEALYGWVQETVRDELRRELEFIAGFRKIRQKIDSIVALPDKQANLFVKLCLQNNGRLSPARRRHFARLTDKEVSALEKVVQAQMSSLRGAAANQMRDEPGKRFRRTGPRRNSS